ncbi:MAG: helix-turn-helix transcriptional regulator [Tannerellaceae bacterium]|jgi:SOS-response transcriptional repressor LexA|nr:helix-turn-helix transcriptional regulator [Tannerellaceae bacterium]
MNTKERFVLYLKEKGIGQTAFEEKAGLSRGQIAQKNKGFNSDTLERIVGFFPSLNINWLITGKGDMEVGEPATLPEVTRPSETRPRIPYNAAAGSVSLALSGVTEADCEQMPFVRSFQNYHYTIFVKGDSMEPEFHSGDEVACLEVKDASYTQWGKYHILDTAQGIIIKRVYKGDGCIICKSEENGLYPDFEIPDDEVYNIGLVIGLLRRY